MATPIPITPSPQPQPIPSQTNPQPSFADFERAGIAEIVIRITPPSRSASSLVRHADGSFVIVSVGPDGASIIGYDGSRPIVDFIPRHHLPWGKLGRNALLIAMLPLDTMIRISNGEIQVTGPIPLPKLFGADTFPSLVDVIKSALTLAD